MRKLNKKIFATSGATSIFMGPGRLEFDPMKPMPTFDVYLKNATQTLLDLTPNFSVDEGVIGSFMSPRFINQANLPAILPMIVPELKGKPCLGVEGACGTGGRAIAAASRSILSGLADVVFVACYEIQNSVKSVYGADILAGAGYYQQERKKGDAFFFPGVFSNRAGAYFDRYGKESTREAFARWYELSILNARKNPKAQEFHNKTKNLFELAMTPPDADKFLPHLNVYDCSKVSDGAAAILIASEEGLRRLGIDRNNAVEIIGIGESEGDISETPSDLTHLENNERASKEALSMAGLTHQEMGLLEIHDCFTISALLALEAIGFCPRGKGAKFVIDGNTAPTGIIPTNTSGGLSGFGHPTGASGIRQMVDLWQQLTVRAPNPIKLKSPYGLMISMGGNDKTVTSFVVKGKE